MALVVGCSVSTLQRNFDQAIKKGRACGRASLRRKQFEVAMSGNATMLIWLGKVRLGQKEVAELEVTDKRVVLRMPQTPKSTEEWLRRYRPIIPPSGN